MPAGDKVYDNTALKSTGFEFIGNTPSSRAGHPCPPLWALGYHQSRFAYKSEAGLMRVAREFRRRRIPCDAIHLDIDYMDGYRCFTWHPRRFPDPERMTRELAEMGMRVVTIIDPGIKADERFWVYREGIERDSFAKRANGKIFVGYVWPGKCAFPDFTKPEVRRWWASLHENLLAKGVAGIWNDMNEPACKNLTQTSVQDSISCAGFSPSEPAM